MNASTSLPTSIHLKPTRLAGLLLAAAALSAVITWVLLVFVVNGSNDAAPLSASARASGTFPQNLSVLSPTERAYVEAVDRYLSEGKVLYGPIYGVSEPPRATTQAVTFPQDLSVLSPTERAYVEAVDRYLSEGTVLYGPIYGVSEPPRHNASSG